MKTFNVFHGSNPYTVKADRFEFHGNVDNYQFYKDDKLVASFPAHNTVVIDSEAGDRADL